MAEKRGPGRPPLTEKEKAKREKQKAEEQRARHEKLIKKSREIREKERQKLKNDTERRIRHREKKLLETNAEQAGFDMSLIESTNDPLGTAMYWASQKPVNIENVNELSRRISDYFHYAMEKNITPTKAGLRLALGMKKSNFTQICTGARRDGSIQQALILKAMDVLEHRWESLMLDSKIHPATGIFIGKNQFGYKDTAEVVTVSQQPMGEMASPEQLAEKYQERLKGIEAECKEIDVEG